MPQPVQEDVKKKIEHSAKIRKENMKSQRNQRSLEKLGGDKNPEHYSSHNQINIIT